MKQSVLTLTTAMMLSLLNMGAAQGILEFTDNRTDPAVSSTMRDQLSTQNNTFGAPRVAEYGSTTRIVFDLLPNVKYSLNPSYLGLQLNIQGARVLPAHITQFGNSVTEYRTFDNMAFL